MNIMYNYSSLEHQLDELLQSICQELQITQSIHSRVDTSYHAVAEWLAADEERFPDIDIDIYPQGSLRIGTTVRPINQQEFDLDLVCELKVNWEKYKNATEVLDLIEARLREHKTYAPMVERKNRCIRLNYKNNFHMDILPACPVKQDSRGCVKVPDRKQNDWKDSNPKGYANWFEEKAKDFTPKFEYRFLLEKSAEIEQLPDLEPVEIKPPLKRAVQLIKRYRDIYFCEELDKAPISIVLTTIAGRLYKKQGSVNEAITDILNELCRIVSNDGKITVVNPMNELEILSERWDENPSLYKHFVEFIQNFREEWIKLNEMKSEGIIEVTTLLKKMFGEEPINKSLIKQAELSEAYRNMDKLSITKTGVLSVAPVAAAKEYIGVRKNTFYGE